MNASTGRGRGKSGRNRGRGQQKTNEKTPQDQGASAHTVMVESNTCMEDFAYMMSENSLKDVFIYDTGASNHIICDSKYATDIRDLPNPITVEGMGGIKKVTQVADNIIFGQCLYIPSSKINIISAGKADEKFTVKLSSDNMTYTLTSKESGIELNFHRNQHRIYVLTNPELCYLS